MKSSPAPHTAQRGIALIEALVALVILALGVLGLAAMQARMLVDTRTTNARATAIRLIGDLSERIRLNAQGAQPTGANALSPYSDLTAATFAAPATTNPTTCDPTATTTTTTTTATTCTPQNQAAYDVWSWRTEVANLLPDGTASIYQINPGQLQVIVAWQANENTDTVLGSTTAPAAAPQQVASSLQVTGGANVGAQCGTGPNLCHIDFIDIPPAP